MTTDLYASLGVSRDADGDTMIDMIVGSYVADWSVRRLIEKAEDRGATTRRPRFSCPRRCAVSGSQGS